MWPLVLLSLALFGIHQLTMDKVNLTTTTSTTTTPDNRLMIDLSSTVGPLPRETVPQYADEKPTNKSEITTPPTPRTMKPTTTMKSGTGGTIAQIITPVDEISGLITNIVNGETVNSTTATGRRMSTGTITVTDPDSYIYTDQPTNKKFNIPKLGNCKPYDGYKRFRNTDGKLWFENTGPTELLEFTHLNINYGFIWKNAPPIETLNRINNSDIAISMRKEINEKMLEMGESTSTQYHWERHHETDTGDWPIEKVALPEPKLISINVPYERRTLCFQLILKCGDYTVYTDEIHYLELDIQSGNCEDGLFAFQTCECSDPEKSCPLVIE